MQPPTVFPTRRNDADSEHTSPEPNFVALNHARLQRLFESLQPRQEAFVKMLPLLFHINHSLLPGHVSQDAPCGICDFSPDTAVAAARQFAKNFILDQRLKPSYAIRGLYLMGSPGTIAYTRDSDLDLWLVHAPELDAAGVGLLQDKAQRIETYAAQLGLELHFFVFDADSFRCGNSLSLSAESSGSTQHFLLLDEFYRSSLLLAGLKPLWWAVPPAEDHRYAAYVEDALRTRKLAQRNYVDFGGLENIPAGEFFGATVWQLYKSIESPYKSVMKLLLMEAYAAAYPHIEDLLSHRYKRALGRPGVTLDALDPYIAMYRRVEEYLLSTADTIRLRLLRRAFYIKANEHQSAPQDLKPTTWRQAIMGDLVRSWTWGALELQHLDARRHWRIDSALDERRDIIKCLQKSYAALSDFARAQGGDKRITETDLTILGRKLYSAFDKKPNKLELMTRGICAEPQEAELSLHQIHFERAGIQWVLFRDLVEPEALSAQLPTHRSSALVEVLAWCFFNRLHATSTAWHCFVGGRRHAPTVMRKVLDTLETLYPARELIPSEAGAFSRPPCIVSATFFINISIETAVAGQAEGSVLTSNRTDAFQFGGRRVSLVQSIDLLIQTSWDELYSFQYTEENCPVLAACEYLNQLDRLQPEVAITPSVHCFDIDYGAAIAQRMTRYLQELLAARALTNPSTTCVHTVALGSHLHDISFNAQGAHAASRANLPALIRALGEPTTGFKHVVFDPACAPDSPLPLIYAENTRGKIQTYGLVRRDRIEVFILDTDGNLLSYVHQDTDPMALFEHLRQFFEKTQRRSSAPDQIGHHPDAFLAFKLLQRGTGTGFSVQEITLSATPRRNYLPLRLFVDLNSAGKPEFNAYLDDQEFSSIEHGNGIFNAIAAAVMKMRAGGGSYPVFITDLELSERLLAARGIEQRQTFEVLRQKLRIERQLSQALAAATS